MSASITGLGLPSLEQFNLHPHTHRDQVHWEKILCCEFKSSMLNLIRQVSPLNNAIANTETKEKNFKGLK